MKIQLSSSAVPLQTNALTATVVSGHQRTRFWLQHFGSIPQWLMLEPRIFGWMDRLCTDYHGGSWSFYTLSNAAPLWLQKMMCSGHCLTA